MCKPDPMNEGAGEGSFVVLPYTLQVSEIYSRVLCRCTPRLCLRSNWILLVCSPRARGSALTPESSTSVLAASFQLCSRPPCLPSFKLYNNQPDSWGPSAQQQLLRHGLAGASML